MDTNQIQNKELVLEMIQAYEKELFVAQVQERFLQRMIIAKNNTSFQQQLGKVQADIQFKKEYLKFLEEIIKEYK